jgi:hypothetical protein
MFAKDVTFFDTLFSLLTPLIIIFFVFAIIFTIVKLLWISRQNKLMRKVKDDSVLLKVFLEKDSEVDIKAIQQMWNTFHSHIPWKKRFFLPQNHFSFEIVSTNILENSESRKEISFNFWVPSHMEDLFRERIKTSYGFSEIVKLSSDYMPDPDNMDLNFDSTELTLTEDSAFSIRQFEDLEVDALSSILTTMSTVDLNEVVVMQVMMRPASKDWNKKATGLLAKFESSNKKPKKMAEWTNYFAKFITIFFAVVDHITHAFTQSMPVEVKVSAPSKTSFDAANQKQMLSKVQFPGYETEIRILVGTPQDKSFATSRLNRLYSVFNELQGPFNGFKKRKYVDPVKTHHKMVNREFNVIRNRDVLTSIELAGFLHLVNKNINTAGLSYIQNKKQNFPNGISKELPFAYAYDASGERQPVGLDLNARMRHVYISGMTGVGKSTLLENMIVSDINSNKGCVVVDPHGELVDVVLEKIDPRRKDVYILDPSDISFPFGFNLLELSSKDEDRREMEKALVVDAYITVMKRVFGEASIGANTDDIFRMSCAAILDHPEGGGLLEMLLILVNETYRKSVIPHIKDPIVKNYWEEVFASLVENKNFAVQNLNAPLNKIRRFLGNSVISNIICQKRSTIDVAEVINSGGVILARFSRGDIGFENSALLGTMLISKIQIAAMQRVSIPMDLRVPTFLYVDEFQNFVGDSGGAKSFAEILSEARKYRLGLIIAHQFLDQLRQSGGDFLMSAIFNNCGTIITFRVGATDAEFFAKIYFDKDRPNEGYRAADIANIGKFTTIIRIMTKDGIQSHPFTAFPLPPVKPHKDANPEIIIERSRSIIGRKREKIRDSINSRAALDTITSGDI